MPRCFGNSQEGSEEEDIIRDGSTLFVLVICLTCFTVNGVGNEGAARLAEMLLINSTLTTLYAGGALVGSGIVGQRS